MGDRRSTMMPSDLEPSHLLPLRLASRTSSCALVPPSLGRRGHTGSSSRRSFCWSSRRPLAAADAPSKKPRRAAAAKEKESANRPAPAKPAETLSGDLLRVRPKNKQQGNNDLLDRVDLAKDVVYSSPAEPVTESEQFQFVDRVLRTPEKGDARLCLPAEVPKYYRLVLDLVEKPGDAAAGDWDRRHLGRPAVLSAGPCRSGQPGSLLRPRNHGSAVQTPDTSWQSGARRSRVVGRRLRNAAAISRRLSRMDDHRVRAIARCELGDRRSPIACSWFFPQDRWTCTPSCCGR